MTFSTTSTNAAARTVSWQASDGVNSSNTVTSTVDIASTPPVLAGAGNTVSYTLGGTAQAVDTGLTVADTSSATLAGATVTISSGLQTGDTLSFTAPAGSGITGSYASGVLTLSGGASLAAYQTALDSVTFSTTSTNAAARTVSWQASDGVNSSNTVTSTVDISASSSPPSWVNLNGGSWNTAANWSTDSVPNSASVEATIGGTQSFTVQITSPITLGLLDLTNSNANLELQEQASLTLTLQAVAQQQSNLNRGTILLDEGTKLLVDSQLINSGKITSKRGAAAVAMIEYGTVQNSGAIVATAGAPIELNNTTINNSSQSAAASVTAQAVGQAAGQGSGALQGLGSSILLDNATIIGGTLQGLIETVSGSQANVLNGAISPVINDAGLLVDPNSSLTLEGAITNADNITLGSLLLVQHANLQILGNVTLNGGGEINLFNEGSSIVGAGTGASLTNVNDTIEGLGSISLPTLTNEGTIETAGGIGALQALTINTGSAPIINDGTLQAGSPQVPFGDLIVSSPVTGIGNDKIFVDSAIEFKNSVSAGQTVTFESGLGFLLLDDSKQFAGTISGMRSDDVVVLGDLQYVKNKMTAHFTGTTSGGTLTVSNGATSVSLNLVGNYIKSTWILSQGANGGTDVVDPPASGSSSADAAQTNAGAGLAVAANATLGFQPGSSSAGVLPAASQSNQAALLTQYAASSFAPGGAGAAVVSPPQVATTPLLASPHHA